MQSELLKTLRDVIHADSDPVRQALFDHVRKTSPAVKLIYGIHNTLSPSRLSSLLVFLFGLKSYLLPGIHPRKQNKALIVAVHENSRKQARQLSSWIGEESITWLRLGLSQLLSPGTYARFLVALPRCRVWMRLFRIVHRLNRQHDFLVACRSTSALFTYLRAREIFERFHPSGVIVSSDSNPEPLAFARAATAAGIPTIFISHAYPTPVSRNLQFTLSILEGEAALEAYKEKGPVRGRVVFCGAECESEPLRPEQLRKERPTIGIFAPKVVLWGDFAQLIADCRRLFEPATILIRWHPSMLGPSRLSTVIDDMAGIVETDPGRLLLDVAKQCDWVIADEGSNVHLGVLGAGVPTIALRDHTVLPESRSDLYGFVENRVVPPSVVSLDEISLDEVSAFFSDDWAQRFRSYDAAYLSSSSALIEKARDEIIQLLAGPEQS